MEQILRDDHVRGINGGDAVARGEAFTVERALYVGALLVAFGLRFVNLGESPLHPVEAAQAWPAWLAATGTPVAGAPVPTSALFYGLQSTLFFVAGGSDILARLLPALIGTALVLLPWWWRSWLGRGAALVAAWLLAIDPWLVTLSRTSDSAILTTGLGLLALTALSQRQAGSIRGADSAASPSRGWERTLAVSLGLLLVSGPQAWSWLPVLALFWWLVTRSIFPVEGQAERDGEGHVGPLPGGIARSTWLWFGAALLIGASGFLAWPAAFGAVGSSLSAWLAQWRGPDGGLGVGWPLLRLAVDQPLLLIFGPLGLILLAVTSQGRNATSLGRDGMSQGQDEMPQGWTDHPLTLSPSHPADRRSDISSRRLALFLALWAGWGLLVLLLPGRTAVGLPMLGLPLLLAASWAIAYLLALPLEDVNGPEMAVLIGVAAILLVAGAIWLALAVESAAYNDQLALTAVVLAVLMTVIWVVFGFWAGWRAAGKLAGLFFAGVLLLVSVRSGWMLVQTGSRMAPDGLFPVTTLPEAPLLADDVQRISSIRFGDPHEAPVQVATGDAPPDPLLGWLLRDMRHLSWVAAPDSTASFAALDGSTRAPLIVAPQSGEQDPGVGGMIGSDYPLTMRWVPAMLPVLPPLAEESSANGLPPAELARLRNDQAWSQATRPQLKWLLYRKITDQPPVNSVTLWATP